MGAGRKRHHNMGAQKRWVVPIALLLVMGACSRTPEPPAASTASPVVETTRPAVRHVVAVLPLQVSASDADTQDYADSLAGHITRALSGLPGLTTVSRESAFRFRDSSELNSVMGQRLGASYLLRGRLQRQAGVLQLDMELIQVSDGSSIWSHHYQRVERELLGLQDTIVEALGKALQVELPRAEGQDDRPASGNLDAYVAALRGDQLATQNDVFSAKQAIEAYQQAVTLDPRYAYAHARLALARMRQITQFPLQEGEAVSQGELARKDVAAALTLAPMLPEAHQANAVWLLGVTHDQAAATAAIRRALTLRPQDPALLSMLALRQIGAGQLVQAVESLRLALKYNPLSAPTLYSLGSVYLAQADYPQAEHVLQQALQLEPGLPLAQAFLAMAVFQQNRTDEAIAIAKQEPIPLWRSYALAMAYWVKGDRAQADVELQQLIDQHAQDAATQIAGVYAQRDDEAKMFHWLEEARRLGDPGLAEIRYMPYIARYASDPRFIALVKGPPAASAGAAITK